LSGVGEMEFAVEFGGEPQDVTVTASGIADVAGLREIVTTVAADERYRAGLLVLYELSGLDMSGISDDELERVTETVMERDWRSQPRAVALVVGERAVEITRLGIAHLGGSRSRRRVFTSYDDAVAWLVTMRA
jgi:hypothetical protein